MTDLTRMHNGPGCETCCGQGEIVEGIPPDMCDYVSEYMFPCPDCGVPWADWPEGAVLENVFSAFPFAKIDRACYIDRLPMSIYHSDMCKGFSVSSGDLVTVETKGLKHYWAKSYMNPKRWVPEDKPAYVLGRLAHTAILGDTAFSNQFVLKAFDSFRTDKAKRWKRRQEIAGKTIVTQNDYDTARYMADEIARDPLAISILEGGIVERTFIVEREGIFIKTRPDFFATSDRIITDYKKSRRDVDRDLIRDITNFDYTMKMANIAEGILENMPELQAETIFDFTYVFIMQSDMPPYAVTTVKIEPKAPIELNGKAIGVDENLNEIIRDTIYLAACQNRRSVKRLADAHESGEWLPPNGGGPITYAYPNWLCEKLSREQAAGTLPKLDEYLREIS